MTTIGRYEVQAEIARGAMGAVYRVLDPLTGQVFALKLLAGVRVSDTTGRRLQREAQALTRLRHPNVVAIHEIGEDRGKPFLVLDMIEGEDLEQRITRGGPLSSRDAAELFLPLAQALGYAHQSGVLHRDLKPANVLIARATGRAFLGDFGLAKDLAAERSSLTVSGQMMGTPGYWPPEQASGDLARVGPASDVYGLGATLYAALTGEPPISGGSLAELLVATIETRPPLPSKRVPGVDPDLEAICMRCLEKDPGDRYPSASALATDLERYLRGEALADAAPRGSGPPLGLLVGLGVVLIAVLSAGVIVLARGSGSREGDLAGTSPRRTAPSASPNVSPTPEVETAAPRHSRGLRQPTPTPRATPFAGQPRPTPTPRPTLLAILQTESGDGGYLARGRRTPPDDGLVV
ncbi:MAG: serine/threonine protein kinase, partial [Planctomycetes bacterium]|nr:serine/threonine protein kinase [Planctomycetota bacterium]